MLSPGDSESITNRLKHEKYKRDRGSRKQAHLPDSSVNSQ